MATSETTWVVCGLGNPGSRYENTRHNLGFLAAQDFFSGSIWKTDSDAIVCHREIGGRRIYGVMPQSFMNLSGEPLSRIMKFYKIPPSRLIVLHDELDLELGSLRVKIGGGIAGHNGLRSIVEQLGTKDFFRIRLGIGRPAGQQEVVSWVLAKFTREDQSVVAGLLPRSTQAIETLITDGIAKSQSRFN